MTDSRLFDPGPGCPTAELSADQRRTLRRQGMLNDGTHPATRLPLLNSEWGYSCRDCAEVTYLRPSRKRYWKCRRAGITGGPGTDIRVSWPACAAFRMEAAA